MYVKQKYFNGTNFHGLGDNQLYSSGLLTPAIIIQAIQDTGGDINKIDWPGRTPPNTTAMNAIANVGRNYSGLMSTLMSTWETLSTHPSPSPQPVSKVVAASSGQILVPQNIDQILVPQNIDLRPATQVATPGPQASGSGAIVSDVTSQVVVTPGSSGQIFVPNQQASGSDAVTSDVSSDVSVPLSFLAPSNSSIAPNVGTNLQIVKYGGVAIGCIMLILLLRRLIHGA